MYSSKLPEQDMDPVLVVTSPDPDSAKSPDPLGNGLDDHREKIKLPDEYVRIRNINLIP
jgi:hypothetical protein